MFHSESYWNMKLMQRGSLLCELNEEGIFPSETKSLVNQNFGEDISFFEIERRREEGIFSRFYNIEVLCFTIFAGKLHLFGCT